MVGFFLLHVLTAPCHPDANYHLLPDWQMPFQ